MRDAAFLLVIFLSNVIQGITGFAGTILAMPPGLMLVGYDVARPVLNALGLLSGIYVFAGNREKVCWAELKRIAAVMSAGIAAGLLAKGYFAGRESILYPPLGIFVLLLAIQGLAGLWKAGRQGGPAASGSVLNSRKQGEEGTGERPDRKVPGKGSNILSWGLLGLAGFVHGIFVSGGPLLIGYLTKRLDDKKAFRATISTVWILLNSIILIDDIRTGLWGSELIKLQLISIPFFLGGMALGGKLVRRMSQNAFMIMTYILLMISGISLLLK